MQLQPSTLATPFLTIISTQRNHSIKSSRFRAAARPEPAVGAEVWKHPSVACLDSGMSALLQLEAVVVPCQSNITEESLANRAALSG